MIVNKLNFLLAVITFSCIYADDYDNDDRIYLVVPHDHHQKTPRLEDFFWTGSGDGPPPPPDPPIAPVVPTKPVIRTTTVLATVYLDSYPPQAVTDRTGECILNCGEPVDPGSLEPDIPEDRRYWLLTVIQGSTPDSLQLKLARLYQKAFLRQQEKHLGIIKSLDAPTARKKHEVHSFLVNKDTDFNPSSPSPNTPFKYLEVQSSMTSFKPFETLENDMITNEVKPTDIVNRTGNVDEFFAVDTTEALNSEFKATKVVESWILATPTVVIRKRDTFEQLGGVKEELNQFIDIDTADALFKLNAKPSVIVSKRDVSDQKDEMNSSDQIEEIKEDLIDIPLENEGFEGNETVLFKREIIKPEQQPPVHVHIQNITESPETGSVQIVYVVLVGGRAVPAAVAARDMRLVRDAEVAKELGAVVTTKAEPYLKAAEGLEGEAESGSVHGTELWALVVGATAAVLLLLVLLAILCFAHRKKQLKSAQSLRAYRNELMREVERNQLKQVHEEKDGRLISVVSPSRTRPSSTLLPIYRAASASSSSTTSSGVSEVASALRRRPKKPHALRMPQKKRVGTTDSLLEAAGLDSSDSGQPSVPQTPTSYLSMPSVNSFPRGNIVEPLSRILEPVSVRHLDIDSSSPTPPRKKDVVPRRQMPSQLVRLGSIDKDPGVIGPLVWDLHCQRIKDASKPPSPAKSAASIRKGQTQPGSTDQPGSLTQPGSLNQPGSSRMRQRFNELMDDAFTLFGSTGSSPDSHHTYTVDNKDKEKKGAESSSKLTQARNDNVRLPGSPYTALDTVRGKSAGPGPSSTSTLVAEGTRPRTSISKPPERKAPPPATAWGPTPTPSLGRPAHAPVVNMQLVSAEGRLDKEDPAIPLISAIKTEIQRIRDNAQRSKD